MGLQKLSSTDAFVLVDLDGVEHADGIVRLAKKVLVDGARTIARSRTYSWALLERRISGASAGINAAPEDRDGAVAAFVDEVTGQVANGSLALDPGKGLDSSDLKGLAALHTRSPLADAARADLLATGITAAADVALDGVSGTTAVLEGAGTATSTITKALTEAGAEVVGTGDGAEVAAIEADLLVCGSKLGLVDHEVASVLRQRAIVPCGPAPVTAKGLAVSSRRGIVVMADFVTLLGPLLAFRHEADAAPDSLRVDADRTVRQIASDVVGHPDGPYLGAAYRAEEFLRTWRDPLPFGRPLA